MTIYLQRPNVLSGNFMLPMSRGGAEGVSAACRAAQRNSAVQRQLAATQFRAAEQLRREGKSKAASDLSKAANALISSATRAERRACGTPQRYTGGPCRSPYQAGTCRDKNKWTSPLREIGRWITGQCPGPSNIQCWYPGTPPSPRPRPVPAPAPPLVPEAPQPNAERKQKIRKAAVLGSIFAGTAALAYFAKKNLG